MSWSLAGAELSALAVACEDDCPGWISFTCGGAGGSSWPVAGSVGFSSFASAGAVGFNSFGSGAGGLALSLAAPVAGCPKGFAGGASALGAAEPVASLEFSDPGFTISMPAFVPAAMTALI